MWKLRLKLLRRHLTLGRTGEGRRNWLVIGLFVLFIVLTSRVSTDLFDVLRLTPQIGTALTFRVVAMANLTFCVMLIFSSVVSAALVLYSNPEMDFLFTLPVNRLRVFAGAFLESMAATGWMVILFGAPLAVGLGRSFVAGWEYFAVASLSLLGLIILPTALGVFLLCSAFVWIPRHRAKILTFVLGALGAYAFVSFSSRVDIGVLFKMEFDPELHLPAILNAIEVPSHPYTPDTLSAQAMASAVRGEWGAAWRNLGLLWAESAGGLLVLMGLSAPMFFRGWARNEQRDVQLVPWIPFSHKIVTRRPILSLCLKDIKFMFRNIAEWSQVLVLVTLIFVQVVNIRDLPMEEAYLQNFVSFVNLAIAGLLVLAISVRFVYPSFSLEGPGAYLLKTMPIRPGAVLAAKFWTYAVPLLILSQALLFVTNRQTGVSVFFYAFSHSVSAVQTLTIVMIAFHAALIYPPQSRSSLERAAGSMGGILFMIAGSFYIAFSIAYFTAPIYKMLLTVPITSLMARPLLLASALFLAAHAFYFLVWRRLAPGLLARL